LVNRLRNGVAVAILIDGKSIAIWANPRESGSSVRRDPVGAVACVVGANFVVVQPERRSISPVTNTANATDK
jgi:hypothetical protein